jgi:hypothetical protein
MYACGLVVCTSNTSTIKLSSASSFSQSSRYFKQATNLSKYKFFISIFVLLLSCALGFITYGSEQFHQSFTIVTKNARNFSEFFTPIGEETRKATDTLSFIINTTLVKYDRDLDFKKNVKAAQASRKELHLISVSLNESIMSLDPINYLIEEKNNYVYFLTQTDLAEQTRWAIMIGVVTINMLLIVLLIIGLIRNSKGSLCL